MGRGPMRRNPSRKGAARAWTATLLTAALAFALKPEAHASVTASLDETCDSQHLEANDFTANAIVPASGSDGCTVRWISPTQPAPRNTAVLLYFGQPGQVVQLATEPIQFLPDTQFGFIAQRHFSKIELGTQSFVTVLVTSQDEILQWTPWTVRASSLPPELPPAANLSLDIRLGALHLDNARGAFPPSRQAEGVVWQAVGEEDARYQLDGEGTGSPAIRIGVSDSWTPADLGASSIQEALRAKIDQAVDLTGREVKFDDLHWTESRPELVRYEDATTAFERRYYYTVVTLWTDASMTPLGGRQPKRFAHETSASEWAPKSVTEWASYIKSEYTSDPRLLALIEHYASAGKAIPGFQHRPDMRGGDGGDSTFSLRLVARLRPWAVKGDGPDDDTRFRAGIESFAVVGSRAGLSTSSLVQSADEKTALCRGFGLFCGAQAQEATALPRGWYREASSAQLNNAQGNIPILQSPPQTAQFYNSRGENLGSLLATLIPQYRGVMKGQIGLQSTDKAIVLADQGGNAVPIGSRIPLLKLSDLPPKAYFVLGAKLEAGALVRKDGFIFNSYRMIPVNPYVQYIIRTSVIKDLATVLTGAHIREVQNPSELGKNQMPPPTPGWLQRAWAWLSGLPLLLRFLLLAIPLIVLMWAIAPLRPILTAIGRLLGALIDLVAGLLAAVARRLNK